MHLFSRKPLRNTEYNRSDHSKVNKTGGGACTWKDPTYGTSWKTRFQSRHVCWCYNFNLLPSQFGAAAHLCRKVTSFYINLQRAGCQSARCQTPPTPPSKCLIRNGLSDTNLQKLLIGHYGFVSIWDLTQDYSFF